MSANRVTVRVPATSANLGPGFDCLGLALDIWGTITLSTSPKPLPASDDPLAAMAVQAARRLFQRLGNEPPGLSASYDGGVPVARGLGASAIARAGGLLAANAILDEPLGREDLLTAGAQLEGHADNMAPALFGGLQVAAIDGEAVLHVGLPLPDGLKAVLFVPDKPMATRESRGVLPDSVPRADAVHNVGRAALLVAALAAGRLDVLDAATQDRLHQPARSRLMPAMYPLFEAARGAGALCAYLSGGGSTVCALTRQNEQAVADAMAEAARQRGLTGKAMIAALTDRGAEVAA
ncbi:MAG: homoserine kinase [Chloroflexi bacterium]|nr:homoserine kinase [Chloroflexota bacterium]